MDKINYTVFALVFLFIVLYWDKVKRIIWPPEQESCCNNGICTIPKSSKLQKNEIISTEGKTIFVDTL